MMLLEIYLLIINMVAFAAYGIDKQRAIRKEWRISEKSLLLLAALGGALGALFGMHLFHHKTKQLEFVERFPEFSLFYRLFSPLDSEMICIFPYFYPCEESAREIREIFI